MCENNIDVKDLLAVRLKKLREEKGLSQVKLADELGVSRGSINYYESSERTAGIDFIYKAAKYFGCTTDYLLGFSEFKNKEAETNYIQNIGAINSELSGIDTNDRERIVNILQELLANYSLLSASREVQRTYIVAVDSFFFWLKFESNYFHLLATIYENINKPHNDTSNRKEINDMLKSFVARAYGHMVGWGSERSYAIDKFYNVFIEKAKTYLPDDMQGSLDRQEEMARELEKYTALVNQLIMRDELTASVESTPPHPNA